MTLTITDQISELVQAVADMEAAIPEAKRQIERLSVKQTGLMEAFTRWVDAQDSTRMANLKPRGLAKAFGESVTVFDDERAEVEHIALLWLVAQDLAGEPLV